MRKRVTCALAMITFAVMLSSCSGKNSGKKEFKQAKSYVDEGNYKEAAKAFEEAIDKNKENTDYYIQYGAVLVKLHKYTDAIAAYDKAITDDATKKTKAGVRGQGIAYYESKDYEAAINQFLKALSMDVAHSLDEDISYYLASAYIENKQYEKAIEVYSEMIEESSKDAELYSKRALVYEQAGKYDECMKDYDKAIALEKNSYVYYIEKAKMQMQNGHNDQAKETLEKALMIKAKSDEARYQTALVYYYMENRVKAIEVLNGIKEKYVNAYELLGDIYYNASDYQQAAKQYEEYLKRETSADTSRTSYKLSNCYINIKEYGKAQLAIDTALRAQKIEDIRRLKYNQIVVYENSADFNTAYDLAKAYLEEYPDDEDMARELVFLKTRYSG